MNIKVEKFTCYVNDCKHRYNNTCGLSTVTVAAMANLQFATALVCNEYVKKTKTTIKETNYLFRPEFGEDSSYYLVCLRENCIHHRKDKANGCNLITSDLIDSENVHMEKFKMNQIRFACTRCEVENE